jgi:hypothetical protein
MLLQTGSILRENIHEELLGTQAMGLCQKPHCFAL